MRWGRPLAAAAVVTPFVIGLSAGGDRERPVEEFRFGDPDIVESSGLGARDGLFATVNDSGDSGRVFVVDPASGDTTGVVSWYGDPEDVEALAPRPDGGLLVGDIGDNLARRTSVTLHEVPLVREGAALSAEPTTYRLRYPDGARDAETLLVHPRTGRVLVASKGVLGGTLYRAPRRLLAGDDVHRLRPVADVPGMLTDGAFFPDGRHLALRDYSQLHVYTYPGLDRIGSVPLPEQEQGEGLAIDERGRVFVSTEGVNTAVHRVPLPERVTRALAKARSTASPEGGTSTDSPGPPAAVPSGDADAEEPVGSDRRTWTWLLGGVIGVIMLLVLLRALRPR